MFLVALFACHDQPDATQGVIKGDLDWVEAVSLGTDSIAYQRSVFVGYLSTFDAQGSHEGCSATLVAPTLVLTCHHCFWYWKEEDYNSIEAMRSDGVICDELAFDSPGEDVSLLNCAPEKNGGTTVAELLGGYVTVPSSYSQSLDAGDSVFLVEHMCEPDRGDTEPGCVFASYFAAWQEATKKVALGVIEQIGRDDYTIEGGAVINGVGTVVHTADALLGSSGAPLFLEKSGELIGVHHAQDASSDQNLARGLYALSRTTFDDVIASNIALYDSPYYTPTDPYTPAYEFTIEYTAPDTTTQPDAVRLYGEVVNSDGTIAFQDWWPPAPMEVSSATLVWSFAPAEPGGYFRGSFEYVYPGEQPGYGCKNDGGVFTLHGTVRADVDGNERNVQLTQAPYSQGCEFTVAF
jgi:hypothetical protein